METDYIIFAYYGIDFLIVAVILAALKRLAGLVSGVSSQDSLLQNKNNVAFGVSLSGALIAMTVMLTGVVSGEFSTSLLKEFIVTTSYGLMGIIMMWVTRIIFDRISFPQLSIQDQILKGNIAASIIDAGNMIATAIIVRALMMWVEGHWMNVLSAMLVGYAVSQVILVLASKYRHYLYARHNDGKALHHAIEEGNIALAIRFVGYRMGLALAVTSASGIIIFSASQLWTQISWWAITALMMFFLVSGLSGLFKRIILMDTDISEAVDKQQNIAVGCLEASIYVAMGLLIAGLFN